MERAITIEQRRTIAIHRLVERSPIAVVDLGSNSGRLVVYGLVAGGVLEILEDARVPLRLVRSLTRAGRLSEAAFARTLGALAEFRAIARGAGARTEMVVATSAIREAPNGRELIETIRDQLGVEVEIIDGLAEARYAFRGAIHSLPVDDGLVLDIGGGSLELTSFLARRGTRSWTLPLGALRLAGSFFVNDPPAGKELKRLQRHLRRSLREVDLPRLAPGEQLIGTGGTIRNLAKIDRRSRSYPIPRLHGYVVSAERIDEIVMMLAEHDLASRAAVPGLNPDRADSIVAGAMAVQAVMRAGGAEELVVSGQGLREGIAFAALGEEAPPPAEVRQASLAALTARFGAWDARRAERRARLVEGLLDALLPDATAEIRATTVDAATVLDIGRSVDYYNRWSHTATIVTVADLGGFSHRALALLAAVIREAERRQGDLSLYAPLLGDADVDLVSRAGVILLLADEMERRAPDDASVVVRAKVAGEEVRLEAPPISPYAAESLAARFSRAFGRTLALEREGTLRDELEAQ